MTNNNLAFTTTHKRSQFRTRWVTITFIAATLILSLNTAFAMVSNPTLTGPITCSSTGITCSPNLFNALGQPLPTGLPQSSQVIYPDFASTGYTEKEYFMEGDAIKYQNSLTDNNGVPLPLTSDGFWQLTPQVDGNGNLIKDYYKTRILVRAPSDPKKFNGTVLMEWANVTAGYDFSILASFFTNKTISKNGNAYVLVSAQRVGVLGIQSFDTRYASLVHPGDDYSFDIFSQAAKAIRNPVGINPLAGLKVKKIIAMGQSQSGFALVTYVNGIQPITKMFDGFLVDSRFAIALNSISSLPTPYPSFFRTDLSVPVLNYEEETGVSGNFGLVLGAPNNYYFARQPDTAKLKTWEVAGAGHITEFQYKTAGLSRRTGLTGSVVCPNTPINDGLIQHYVHNAALRALNIWVNTGVMVAQPSPALSVDPPAPSLPIQPIQNVVQYNNMIGPDGLPYGIAKGGIRTPFVDVPIGVNSGKGNDLTFSCSLAGTTIPYDASTIKALYPTHLNYVIKVANSTLSAVLKGFITPDDGLEIISNAINSDIGK